VQHQKHLLGGMNKLFTVQYKRLDLVDDFADATSLTAHYEFKFVRREFLVRPRARL